MKFGSPLKQDLGWCPDGKTAMKADRLSFKGPFLHITTCLEKTGHNRKNRWCLMFITSSMMIIMPVQYASLSTNKESGEAAGPKRAKPAMRQLFPRENDSVIRERLDRLRLHYTEKDSDEAFIAEQNTNAIPLDTIKELTITWVSSSGRFSGLLFPLSMYPAKPANAGYRVNFQLAVTSEKKRVIVITPFSSELRQTLRDLLGERVNEIPDEYAPLL